MKIGVADPNRFKFSGQLIEHWKKLGHTIYAHVANIEQHNECDAVFYDQASANVIYYSERMPRQKRVVVRAIDIENYLPYHRRFAWDKIDYLVFINNAQLRLLREDPQFTCPPEKIRVIPPGVNLNKSTLKKSGKGRQVVFVGDLYPLKNAGGAIDLVYELNKMGGEKWKLHIRGKSVNNHVYEKYLEYRAKSLGVDVAYDAWQEDMNAYLEDKDLMIVSSLKEAFSYAAAEAMAKGIPAVINNWYGAYDVWPQTLVYNTPNEGARLAYKLLEKPPIFFRNLIAEKYPEERMLAAIDELMGIKND